METKTINWDMILACIYMYIYHGVYVGGKRLEFCIWAKEVGDFREADQMFTMTASQLTFSNMHLVVKNCGINVFCSFALSVMPYDQSTQLHVRAFLVREYGSRGDP